MDEPTDLPEGAQVALEIVEDVLASEMSLEERTQLEASIETARVQAMRGEGVDGDDYLDGLRPSRR